MIDVSQWRSSIGSWYCHHIPYTTKKTPSTTDTPGWIKSLLMSGDEGGGTLIFSLVLFLLLLLILSGDIELNPGPKTELTAINALRFLIKSGFVVEDKWNELTSFLGVSLEERERLNTMARSDQDYHFALEEGLQWWITNGTAPCWEELISAVENCGDIDIAATLKRQLDIKDEERISAKETNAVHKVLNGVLTINFVDLSEQLSRCLPQVSSSMYSKRLISESVRDSPTVYNVIDEFESGMKLADNISKLQEHCQLFLQCLSSEGGPTKLAAQKLCQDWIEEVKKQCDISLDLTCDEQVIMQQVNNDNLIQVDHPITSVQYTTSQGSNIHQIKIESVEKEKELMTSLQNLLLNFSTLIVAVRSALNYKLQHQLLQLEDLILFIKYELYWVEELSDINKCNDLNELFKILHPYFDFLDCELIVHVSKRFLNNEYFGEDKENLVSELKEYMNRVQTLRSSITVKELKNQLKSIYTSHRRDLSNMPQINIELNNPWNDASIQGLYLLTGHLLPYKSKHSILKYIEIDGVSVIESIPSYGNPIETSEMLKSFDDNSEATSIEKYIELLDRAKEEGYVTVKRTKFSLSGPPGTGKSSILKLLFNEEPPIHHHSTPIVQAPEARVMIATAVREKEEQADTCKWEKVDAKYLKGMIVQGIKDKIRPMANTQTKSQLSKSQLLNQQVKRKDSSDNPEVPITTEEETGDSSELPSPTSQELLDLLPQLPKSSKLYDLHWIYAIDTGGQAAFLDIAPALLHGHSVNIFTHKLIDRLEDKAKFYFSYKGNIGEPKERQITNLQLLIASVHSLSSQNRGTKHTHLIVGTFKDQMAGSGDIESLKDKNKCLWSALEPFKKYLSVHFQEMKEVIYPVNAISRSDHEMKMANKVRNIICQCYKENEVPIRWFLFQLDLQKKVEETSRSMMTISKLECIKIGKALKMDEENVENALMYYHDLTIFLYFKEILPDVVFLHPQPLFTKLSELLSISFDNAVDYLKEKDIDLSPGYQEELKNKGTFEKELLTSTLNYGFSSIFKAEDFLILMTKLFILAYLPEQQKYFLPSVLPTTSLSEPIPRLFTENIDPLILTRKWNCKEPLPRGVFPALAVYLLRTEASPTFHLFDQQQYSNVIILCANDCCIQLVDSINCIKIYYRGSLKKCFDTQTAVCEGLRNVMNNFRYSNGNKDFEAHFYCMICFNDPSEHFCRLSEDKTEFVCCKNYNTKPINNFPRQLPWLQTEGTTSDPRTKQTLSSPQGATDVSPERVREILKTVLQEQSANLTDLLYGCLRNVAMQMYSKGLITEPVYCNPTYISVMNDYENGMKYKTVPELEKHCQLFLDCLSSQGGPVQGAAKAIAGYWKDEVNKELGIILNLNVKQ